MLLIMAGDVKSCPGPFKIFSFAREDFKKEIIWKRFENGTSKYERIKAKFDLFEEFLRSHDELDIIALP